MNLTFKALAEYEALVAAIKALPQPQQQVMSLWFEHNLTLAQIARSMGASVDEVQMHKERACQSLTPPLLSVLEKL